MMLLLNAAVSTFINSIKELGSDMLFVNNPVCPVCKRVMFFDENILCKSCVDKLNYINDNECHVCGSKINSENILCDHCMSIYSMDAGKSVFTYDNISSCVIHDFKYNRNRYAAKECGKRLAERLADVSWIKDIDIITCVPCTAEKLNQRGYNQAALIALALSDALNIEVNNEILLKCRETKDQIGLSYEQRFENVKNAFEVINYKIIENKTVLIADDVFTSGATINECTNMLKKSGARTVYFATVALARE